MNKRILITGSLGHVGSELIHTIKSSEFDEVQMIDNLSTQRYASLFNLPKGVNFYFIEEDILKADLVALTKDMDVVIHLAAITDAPASFERCEEVEQVNYEGTRLVAEACVRNGCKLLFPSTTSVYGSQEEIVDETCPIDELKPQSPYAESKLKSEKLLEQLSRSERLEFVICRFGTIFGTSIGMRFHTAVNKFCWQAVMRQPLTIWRTAFNQKRPYLGINDAVESMRFIVKKNLFDGRVYNVVTTNITVSDIIDIISLYVPDVKIEFVHTEIMNQLSYQVLNRRIEGQGFRCHDNIEQGIKETIHLLKEASGF